MLNKENLKEHINNARPLFSNLQKLYQRLPETSCQCDTPGRCCTTMPEMTVVEALQWMDVVVLMAPEEKLRILRNFLAFYLTTPLLRPFCPFLQNNGCAIYTFRTFACRAYGLWSVKTGDQRTVQNRDNRQKIVKMWQQMGVDLPEEKVVDEMDYCDRVVSKTTKKIDDLVLLAELRKIYEVSSAMSDLQEQFETDFHSDFSYLITCLLFSPKKAVLGKLAVIKELHEKGTDSRLQKFLSKVSADAF
jgi:Fe-S-cluster containining protein